MGHPFRSENKSTAGKTSSGFGALDMVSGETLVLPGALEFFPGLIMHMSLLETDNVMAGGNFAESPPRSGL